MPSPSLSSEDRPSSSTEWCRRTILYKIAWRKPSKSYSIQPREINRDTGWQILQHRVSGWVTKHLLGKAAVSCHFGKWLISIPGVFESIPSALWFLWIAHINMHFEEMWEISPSRRKMFKFMMSVCRVVQLRVYVCDNETVTSCHSLSYCHEGCPVTRVRRELCIKYVSVLGPWEGITKL